VIQVSLLLFAWLMAVHTAGRRDRIQVILRAIAVASGISAVYGIAQYFGWDPFLPTAAYHVGEGVWTIVRPPGTFGYVSYFATWLLCASFLNIALAYMEESSVWRSIAIGSAALGVTAMFLTGTRAAILGLVAGALWGRLVTCRRLAIGAATRAGDSAPIAGGRKIANLRRWPIFAALILCAGVAFYYSPPGLQLRSRARWFAEDPWGGNRLNLRRDSLLMGLARIPLGYGPEVFTATFPSFESKALAEAYPNFSHESSHNIFLDALISQGVPGLLILGALCVLSLWGRPVNSPQQWVRAALVAGIVSQMFTVFTIPTALIFYTMIALAIGLASEPVEQRRDWRIFLAAAPIALALLYLAARFTIADRSLELARHSLDSGDLQSAVSHYDDYQHWHLPGTTADLWYSRAVLGLAQTTKDPAQRYQAIAHSGAAAVRATQAAEDPFNAWYNMSTLYAIQNDAQRTEQSLRAAIAASPNWFKPHWTLAQLLRLENRMEEAERESSLAAELNAGKNPEVAQTLAQIRAQRSVTLTSPRQK
jgi:tetratricopeptide (TPR) repeat protein